MKKQTAIISAATAILLCSGVGAAAYAWKTTDVATLQQGLLQSGAPAQYDLDNSGEVDVFDLGLLKREVSGAPGETGEATAQTIPATADHVKRQSRTLEQDGVTWLLQSGSAVECILSGREASVTLAGDAGITSGEDYRPRYGIFVDGELRFDALLGEKELTIRLWEEERTAEVAVMLLSEAMYGAVGVKDFAITSADAAPVKPVPARELSIEFIGDSITCAYGVEGASQSESFKTSTENFSKSYAYLTAQQLDADYSTCCYSGHGITSGYSQGEKNASSLIPTCYGLNSKFPVYGMDWDFAGARQHDAVVINLGTNDINYVAADPDTRSKEFVTDYVAFLTTVREKNPKAAILCTVGTMGGDEIYTLIEQAVEQFRRTTGDERVSCYFSKTHSMADGLGSDWHPSAGTQQNSAYVLADKICQSLGRESDQIGLDVAADAVYDLRTRNGANAAHYVSDFDKSFWINTVTGGSSEEDIEGVLSGIGLKKGGKYVLSFDATGGEAECLVRIAGTQPYLTEPFEVSQAGEHFEAAFVAESADTAEIIFEVGGRDSYNLTLKNIKLIKRG